MDSVLPLSGCLRQESKSPGPGQESIHGTAGPLASQSVEDLNLFQRAVIDQEPWETETSLVPLPWRQVKATKNMTVGIMWDDGYSLNLNHYSPLR